jgi:hypothetical protein
MLFLDTKSSKPGYRSFRPFIGFRVLIMPPPLMVILNIDMCKPNIDTGISARSAIKNCQPVILSLIRIQPDSNSL